MSSTGAIEAFKQFGNDISDGIKQEWKNRLLDDNIGYKRSIILHYWQYQSFEKAVEDFGLETLKHAVDILRKNGYTVDLTNGIISKT